MLPLELALKPSKFYLTFFTLLLLVSNGIVLLLITPIWIKLSLILLLNIYGGYLLWQLNFYNADAIHCLYLGKEQRNRWELRTRSKVYYGELIGDSTVTQIISILRFRLLAEVDRFSPKKNSIKTCIVLRDSLKTDAYRQLIVRCRLCTRKVNG